MDKKLHYHVQSVLVPVGHFNNMAQAQSHVAHMGFNPEFKKPHITHNYIRFRQYSPKVGENYKTTPALDKYGTKAVISPPQMHQFGFTKAKIHPSMRPRLLHPKYNVLDGEVYHPVHHN